MQSDQENFLARWSRRKQQALQEPEIPQTLEEEISASQQSGLSAEQLLQQETALTEDVEQPVLTDEDMPPIESLTEDSDYSGFMSKGVSDELRNLALRKLFKASIFNVRDGLDEYDDDFTSFEKLGDIVTCDMKHQIEMEAKKKLEREAEAIMDEDEMEEIADEEEEVLEPQQLTTESLATREESTIQTENTNQQATVPEQDLEKTSL